MVGMFILYALLGVAVYVVAQKMYKGNGYADNSDDYFELAVLFMLLWPIGLTLISVCLLLKVIGVLGQTKHRGY